MEDFMDEYEIEKERERQKWIRDHNKSLEKEFEEEKKQNFKQAEEWRQQEEKQQQERLRQNQEDDEDDICYTYPNTSSHGPYKFSQPKKTAYDRLPNNEKQMVIEYSINHSKNCKDLVPKKIASRILGVSSLIAFVVCSASNVNEYTTFGLLALAASAGYYYARTCECDAENKGIKKLTKRFPELKPDKEDQKDIQLNDAARLITFLLFAGSFYFSSDVKEGQFSSLDFLKLACFSLVYQVISNGFKDDSTKTYLKKVPTRMLKVAHQQLKEYDN